MNMSSSFPFKKVVNTYAFVPMKILFQFLILLTRGLDYVYASALMSLTLVIDSTPHLGRFATSHRYPGIPAYKCECMERIDFSYYTVKIHFEFFIEEFLNENDFLNFDVH